MSDVLVIGNGQAFEMAKEICRGDGRFHLIEIKSTNGFQYELGFLDEFDVTKHACAVALDPYAVNFPRIDLLLEINAKGFEFASLISKRSSVSADAKLQKGVIVGPNSVVHSGCTIGYGSTIYAGVTVGHRSAIKPNASLLDGAHVGAECRIGLGSTIGRGVMLADGAIVGRHCELLRPGNYVGEIKDRTFRDSFFPNGMVIQTFN